MAGDEEGSLPLHMALASACGKPPTVHPTHCIVVAIISMCHSHVSHQLVWLMMMISYHLDHHLPVVCDLGM
jgi:hypothetical protein